MAAMKPDRGWKAAPTGKIRLSQQGLALYFSKLLSKDY
jgi:hypothetical protein